MYPKKKSWVAAPWVAVLLQELLEGVRLPIMSKAFLFHTTGVYWKRSGKQAEKHRSKTAG